MTDYTSPQFGLAHKSPFDVLKPKAPVTPEPETKDQRRARMKAATKKKARASTARNPVNGFNTPVIGRDACYFVTQGESDRAALEKKAYNS